MSEAEEAAQLYSAPSWFPDPYLTAPLPSLITLIFFYFKTFTVERGDIDFVSVSHP